MNKSNKSKRKYSDSQIRAGLLASHGNVTRAAMIIGCSKRLIQHRVTSDGGLKAHLQQIRALARDHGEGLEFIGSVWPILDCRGRAQVLNAGSYALARMIQQTPSALERLKREIEGDIAAERGLEILTAEMDRGKYLEG